jgi:hypothetical protein
MVLIRKERKPDYAVRWQPDDGVQWAHHDGLVIALVPSRHAFDRAFHLVYTELRRLRGQEPGAGGRLVLDTGGEWRWPDGVIDFDRYTNRYNLATWRISLSLADGESLEAAGNRQFAEHSDALQWARRAVTDR